jgi:hypothetical protein
MAATARRGKDHTTAEPLSAGPDSVRDRLQSVLIEGNDAISGKLGVFDQRRGRRSPA